METLSQKNIRKPFWSLSVASVAESLKTDIEQGLSESEVETRIKIFGPNVVERARHTQGLLIFLDQFKSPLILILLIAGSITFLIGEYRDTLFIFTAVLVNVSLGFYQEYKAERVLSELKTFLKQRTRVTRNGKQFEIDAVRLVPGDIIHLAQGDRVPADCRVTFLNDFQVDESVLTGESLPVTKTIDPVAFEKTIADQDSMLFTGTLITQGIAIAVVTNTGLSTEFGKIAELATASIHEDTPLQSAIKEFSIIASIILLGATVIIFGLGITFGYSPFEMFLTAVAIGVSAVPEGLPIAMTVILAIGVQRMARRKGVIRKLVAAESLGSASIILTDKTGTLTMADMKLSQILPRENTTERQLLELALINTSVLIENPDEDPEKWRLNGRLLETALVKSAGLRGIHVEDVKKDILIKSSLPFKAINKFSASIIQNNDNQILVFFGAADIFIRHSGLNEEQKNDLLEKMSATARSGELVVGVATRVISANEKLNISQEIKLDNLDFRGFITLRDPVRPGVKEALKNVEASGARVIIMTGDHRGTAEAVAEEIGLRLEANNVLDASELQSLSESEFRKRLPQLRVISRIAPLDKMRVIKAFQKMGEIVAMTGDGINDAPSIKQANIGIAMGSGTEVARNLADLVLLDDNFETIVAAIEEGHRIIKNIRKVIVYLFSNVADGLFLIGGALLFGLTLPLNALQILWVNFFSDSLPAIAFAFEKNIDGNGKGQSIQKGLFDPTMKLLIFFVGLLTSALLFLLYWLLLRLGYPDNLVRTFIFMSFGTYSLVLAFSIRSLEKSIFQYSLFSNRHLTVGVITGIGLMLVAVYVPFMHSLLNTIPLPLPWLFGVIFVGLTGIALVELGKLFIRRRQIISLKNES